MPKIRLSFILLYEIRACLVAIMNHFLPAWATVSGRSSESSIQGLSLHLWLIITHPGEQTPSPDNVGPGQTSPAEQHARGGARQHSWRKTMPMGERREPVLLLGDCKTGDARCLSQLCWETETQRLNPHWAVLLYTFFPDLVWI